MPVGVNETLKRDSRRRVKMECTVAHAHERTHGCIHFRRRSESVANSDLLQFHAVVLEK